MESTDWGTKLMRAAMARHAQRTGQAYFNAAAEMWPGLLDQIVGTDADPFYDNKNLGRFFIFLAANVDA